MNIESSLQSLCDDLLSIVLNTTVGASPINCSHYRVRRKVQQGQSWFSYEDRLQGEKAEYEAAHIRQQLEEKGGVNGGDEVDQQQVEERIARLQKEYCVVASKKQRDEIMIKRVLQVPIIFNCLQLGDNQEEDKVLRDSLLTRDRKVAQLMELAEKIKQVRDDTHQVKKKNQLIREENSTLWESLQKKKETVGHGDKEKEIQLLISKNTVLRHILRSLIIESGVNWAQDQEWRGFMLEEEP